jgi:hypothetical protein
MTIAWEDLLFWLLGAGLGLVAIGFILGECAAIHHENHKRGQ